MGRKSSAKSSNHSPGSSGSSEAGSGKSGLNPLILGAIIVAVIAVGAVAFMRTGDTPAAPAAANPADAGSPTDASALAKGGEPTAEIIAATEAAAAVGPHKQDKLPPIPYAAYPPPRPVDVVDAAFHFAAEHPEITSYVPCFCGCQRSGHKGNTDCFVRSRAANGDVLEWEEHGLECAVCIDVATRSRQMYASGASVRDIRTAVEKEFGPKFTTMTPTPKPPAAAHSH